MADEKQSLPNSVNYAMLKPMRRWYPLRLRINGKSLDEVVIDSHYEKNHKGSISDSLILELVKTLHEGRFESGTPDSKGFEYFANDLFHGDKLYRLVWCLPPDESYIGIVNAYRRNDGKKTK